jgi:hypothetical protein
VHQYITQQAASIWNTTEILQHILRNNVYAPIELPCQSLNNINISIGAGYNQGDDILVGSGEEDQEINTLYTLTEQLGCIYPIGYLPPYREFCPGENEGLNGFFEHFWDPDYPKSGGYNCGTIGGGYNEGLSSGLKQNDGHFDSSYRLAQWYWDQKVIPLYLSGKKEGNEEKVNEAYYWLGRVAHLLEDATVPAHVHLLPHDPWIGGKDWFEKYTSDIAVISRYSGSNFLGKEYKYENLYWIDVHDQSNPPNLFK